MELECMMLQGTLVKHTVSHQGSLFWKGIIKNVEKFVYSLCHFFVTDQRELKNSSDINARSKLSTISNISLWILCLQMWPAVVLPSHQCRWEGDLHFRWRSRQVWREAVPDWEAETDGRKGTEKQTCYAESAHSWCREVQHCHCLDNGGWGRRTRSSKYASVSLWTLGTFNLSIFASQREIENSYASNADYVHKSVLFTEEGRKRYAGQVFNPPFFKSGWLTNYCAIHMQKAIEDHIRAKKQKGTLIDRVT